MYMCGGMLIHDRCRKAHSDGLPGWAHGQALGVCRTGLVVVDAAFTVLGIDLHGY